MAAPARDHCTTEELLAVTKSTRDILYQWVAQRLLLRPRIADSNGKQFAAWTPETLERVRFIVASQRRGKTLDEIKDLMATRWPR